MFAPSRVGDTDRFLGQAQALAAGQGYTLEGEYALYLPPGYPFFLALLRLVGIESLVGIGVVQAMLSVLSCWLIFEAVRTAGSRNGAFASAYLLALNPFWARYSWTIKSESFGFFLASLSIWAFSLLYVRGARSWWLLFGAAGAALVLTVPATVFVPAFLSIVALYKRGGWIRGLSVCVLGALLIGGPWSLYIHSVCGRFTPPPVPGRGVGFNVWVRTWSTNVRDVKAYWGTEYLEGLPSSIFADTEERNALLKAHSEWREYVEEGSVLEHLKRSGYTEHQRGFVEAASRRSAELGELQLWLLTARRSFSLWFDYWHADWFRVGGDWSRAATAAWPLKFRKPFRLIYFLYFILYLSLIINSFRRREPIGLAVFLGILLYTVVSSHWALGEVRRNLPFLPFLFFLFGCTYRRGTERAPGS